MRRDSNLALDLHVMTLVESLRVVLMEVHSDGHTYILEAGQTRTAEETSQDDGGTLAITTNKRKVGHADSQTQQKLHSRISCKFKIVVSGAPLLNPEKMTCSIEGA